MKKVTILILSCIMLLAAEAKSQQVISKKQAKKVAKTVNRSLNEMTDAIEATDWKSLGDILNTTILLIDKHVDALTEISKSIDTKQLEKNAERIALKLEESIDQEKLEQDLDRLSKKIEKALELDETDSSDQ
ncbi:MAG: hypothetical protein R2831_01890 [Chitinophagaceae bacterium]